MHGSGLTEGFNVNKIEESMVDALVEWFEKPEREEETVREVAEGIVDSIFKHLKRQTKEAPPTIKVGEPFKDTVSGKVQTPLWESDGLWWIVTSDSSYGFLGPVTPWQRYAAPTRAAGAKTENKDGWQVGDRLSLFRTKAAYEIICVTEKAALLMHDGDERPIIEPNASLEKFYRKAAKPTKLF